VQIGDRVVLSPAGLEALFAALAAEGRDIVGPTVRDGAIVLDHLKSTAELPRGVGDEQGPGRYRLRERGDEALFGYAASPHSPKRELFPPRVPLVQVRRSRDGLAFSEARPEPRKIAFVGTRACELAAIGVQDRVLVGGSFHDADYAARREDVLVFAVHCTSPAGTCFCASMDTGPKARAGYDLGAVELLEPTHHFVIDVGSEAGRALLERIDVRPAEAEETARADRALDEATGRMGRALDTTGLREALAESLEHPRWQEVADRCLGCANCTMSCPTCFCTTVEDTTDLSGEIATRERRHDSCFTMDFAYVHGGSTRPSLRARYRQWLTHKLSSWHDQFGTSGCVGCGRCITWCPVGIDITEEAAALRVPPTRSRQHG
jgi:ferredoxin